MPSGPKQFWIVLGQNIRMQCKILERKAYFVNVYDALLPPCCHFEHVGQTEAFSFERALTIALYDDVSFFEKLVENYTIFLEVKVETAFAFADR